MIITRSPLRISLGGGGTDLPSFYRLEDGFVLAAAIDRYVYTSISRPFSTGINLKYSQLESVSTVSQVQHPIIRECLKLMNLNSPQIEISTIADIPSGTGLGSSGSFTTGLLKGLFAHYKKSIQADKLAELACRIEIDLLNEPVGKQDQYIAAFGGITEFIFKTNGEVKTNALHLPQQVMFDLEDNLLLFFTGISRKASSILLDQDVKSKESDQHMLKNLQRIKLIGLKSRDALQLSDLETFGGLMHEHWIYKRERTKGMSNSHIDDWYKIARDNGAIGGKLVGAGGGGFLMFYASDPNKLRSAMSKIGLEEMRFKFEFEGTKVVHS